MGHGLLHSSDLLAEGWIWPTLTLQGHQGVSIPAVCQPSFALLTHGSSLSQALPNPISTQKNSILGLGRAAESRAPGHGEWEQTEIFPSLPSHPLPALAQIEFPFLLARQWIIARGALPAPAPNSAHQLCLKPYLGAAFVPGGHCRALAATAGRQVLSGEGKPRIFVTRAVWVWAQRLPVRVQHPALSWDSQPAPGVPEHLFCLERGMRGVGTPQSHLQHSPAGIPFLRSSHTGTKWLLCPGGQGRTHGSHPTALPWDAAPE